MRVFMLLLPVVLLSFWVAVLQADTIHVPSQQPTIQAGIDAAATGDTVLVADGTYTGTGNRSIDFNGKVIVVTSENGYETTIVDCEGNGRGFYFHSGEGLSSVLEGFTVKNGDVGGGQGGGLFCDSSSPTIRQCYFSDNIAHSGGGIAFDDDAMPLLEECVITENTATLYGGGIHCDHGSDATISRCEVSFNTSEMATGGIRCAVSSPIISECVIANNTAPNRYCGGIECRQNASPTITKCIISGNSCLTSGGGIRVEHSSHPRVNNCVITNNTANGGGGIVCSTPTSDIVVTNCTIVGNQATNQAAGGVRVSVDGDATVTNSILWDNEPIEMEVETGTLSVTYTNVEGGWTGEGNIDEDPLFVGGDPFDYHLTKDSPCIDTGDPNSPPDPDGSRADMGAYYYQGALPWVVVPDAHHYHRTESLGFTVTATNDADTSVFFQAWTEVETPVGINIIPSLGPIDVVVAGGETVSSHITQYIPDYAPLGLYIYRVKAGAFPNEVLAEDSFEFFIDPPNIIIEVDPDTTHFHRGDMLGFTATVTSNEDTTVQFQGWSEIETPWGQTISPVLGPADTVLAAHETIQAYISQQIPNDAPFGGPYIYSAKIGIYQEEVWVEDSFEFSIVPGLELPERKYQDWEVVEGPMW